MNEVRVIQAVEFCKKNDPQIGGAIRISWLAGSLLKQYVSRMYELTDSEWDEVSKRLQDTGTERSRDT